MMVNKLDIVVADKQKKAVMIDAAIPNNSNIRKKEKAWEIPKARGGLVEDVEGEGNRPSSGNWNIWGSDLQTGWVAQADPRTGIPIKILVPVLETATLLHRSQKLPGLW